ncbi:MAG: FMN-binding glutamate synthase family protein [Gammaproteobacteria bacterium]|nr:FMN-binding glutamate synthase family protein [Gammaproteobacteria bacterium]
MDELFSTLSTIITIMGWLAGIVMLFLSVVFFYDIFQSKHAVLRNFPVIGHMRYFLERQGEFFRQYFFAHDREEMPFNRATRSWVYKTSKGLGGVIGFGSTNDLREPGTIIFVNSPYPMLEEECTPSPQMTIGEGCDKPFVARQIFNISGMSYGAISGPAVKALTMGAAQAGVWINTGEGGLSPFHLAADCDRIFQIGTAKYGVRDEHGKLSDEKLIEMAQHVKAFEIKISQGAKPGRGGVLPAVKVSPEIARIRGIPVGVVSSSPNRHREIKSPDDLLDMIMRIREVTGRPVGFKVVISNRTFTDTLFEAVIRRGSDSAPDFITVDGGDGGTGAAPQILADHVGLSLQEALPMLVDSLIEAGLRNRVRVIASGKLVTSAKVAWALCAGADFATSARGFMFSLGCIQSMQCHMDTCPTGITTHNKRLQRGLVVTEKFKRVANYAHWVNVEIDKLAHSCGLSNAREFRREHVRLVTAADQSLPLDQLHPYPVEGKGFDTSNVKILREG